MKQSERNQIERVRDENFASKLGKSNFQFLFVGKTNRVSIGEEKHSPEAGKWLWSIEICRNNFLWTTICYKRGLDGKKM